MSQLYSEIDTYSIPDGVDPVIVDKRNELIQDWQDGDIEGVTALVGLAKLYSLAQETDSDETKSWLVETKSTLVSEAEIDLEIIDKIWQSNNED